MRWQILRTTSPVSISPRAALCKSATVASDSFRPSASFAIARTRARIVRLKVSVSSLMRRTIATGDAAAKLVYKLNIFQ
jgi:hypothetical protein